MCRSMSCSEGMIDSLVSTWRTTSVGTCRVAGVRHSLRLRGARVCVDDPSRAFAGHALIGGRVVAEGAVAWPTLCGFRREIEAMIGCCASVLTERAPTRFSAPFSLPCRCRLLRLSDVRSVDSTGSIVAFYIVSPGPGTSTSRAPLWPMEDTSPAASIVSTRRAARL